MLESTPAELSELSALEMLNESTSQENENAVVKNAWETTPQTTVLDKISEYSDEAGSSNRGGSFT